MPAPTRRALARLVRLASMLADGRSKSGSGWTVSSGSASPPKDTTPATAPAGIASRPRTKAAPSARPGGAERGRAVEQEHGGHPVGRADRAPGRTGRRPAGRRCRRAGALQPPLAPADAAAAPGEPPLEAEHGEQRPQQPVAQRLLAGGDGLALGPGPGGREQGGGRLQLRLGAVGVDGDHPLGRPGGLDRPEAGPVGVGRRRRRGRPRWWSRRAP